MGLPRFCALELSSELRDLVLQQETEVLEMRCSLTLQGAGISTTHLNWKAVLILFRVGKAGGPLSLEDRFPVSTFALDEGTGVTWRQCPQNHPRIKSTDAGPWQTPATIEPLFQN